MAKKVNRSRKALAGFKSSPKPIQRLAEVVDLLRQFMGVVVRTNAPRDFVSGTEKKDEAKRELLRRHRTAALHDASADSIAALKDRLAALDSRFVLADEPWRIDEAQWEREMWRPLHQWVTRGYELLFRGMDGPTWPRFAEQVELDEWQEEEQEIEWLLMSAMNHFLPR